MQLALTARRSGISWAGRSARALAVAAVFVTATMAGAVHSEAAAEKYAAIIVDAKTGKTLFSRNADARRYPASLTKIMTLYLTFEALERGQISMSTRLKVSAHSAGQAPSKLGLKTGSTISTKDAIMALITKSANDVAAVLAENLGGSESAFAVKMTERARQLGMKNTVFKNASGLPNSAQVTTARDMAILGRAIQDSFPQYFKLFSTRSYSYAGRKYGNHNRLLGRVDGVDGIKTGYTRASGFNLVSSVNRGNRSIVAVVLGGRTARTRDDHMVSIINKYIGRASTGPRSAPLLVAGAATGNPFRVALDQTPLPRPRPGGAPAELLVASAVPAEGAETSERFDQIEQLFRMAQGDADVELPESASEAVQMVEPAPEAQIDKDGWKIQIGALPTESAALAMLAKARAAMPQLLAGLSPYTEPVAKGSTTLYRARFAGFADKDTARNACAKLAREDFKCLALQ